MQTVSRSSFTTVTTEGAILPADLLRRIVDGRELAGLRPEDYHLAPSERLNEAISRSWNRLLGVWEGFDEQRRDLPEEDRGTTLTRERWLLILLQELGYGRLPFQGSMTIDEADEESARYPISHEYDRAPLHLVTFRQSLDRPDSERAERFRRSPHSLLQEFLNRSDRHLWGIVSSGLRLRVLRDNVSFTRAAYLEFDLEAMMDGEIYADFTLLWLAVHQSRVEGAPETCWLEKWSQEAAEQGTRALDSLRDGVQEAISILGRGFLAHPANGELRQQLQSGDLTTRDYYRQLLRLVYRLIFLFVAEDRNLLLVKEAEPEARAQYYDYYSVTRLRELAARRRSGPHPDLYRSLRLVMVLLREGYPALGLPGLGSYLFSERSTPSLDESEIANEALLDAFRALAFTVENRVLRPVDYKNLGAEELGSVYESLLELHPELNVAAATFDLKTAAGSERKTTGSYYTPTPLINSLLDTALEPVVADRLRGKRGADAEEALLDIKVVDPAAGSGHFLIAAANRLARHLARVRTGDEEPSPEANRLALRDVVRHCIHGVDINEMAVELCKVGLWLETLDPGKPLSFLERNIQCGNSLIGATPALLEEGIPNDAFTPITGDDKSYCREFRKLNQEQRKGQKTLFKGRAPWQRLGNLAEAMRDLDAMDDETVADVRAQEAAYAEMVASQDYLHGRLWADAWCAAFVWPKKPVEQGGFDYPLTEEEFRNIESNPYRVPAWMRNEIQQLAEEYRFLHWHLAFPDVFPPGEQGGFDVVLGNPPWERIKIQEKEWFAERSPEIAGARNKAARTRLIKKLQVEDPALFAAFQADRRKAEGESHYSRNSSRYPLTGRGDINTFQLFAELSRDLLSAKGRAGIIVPDTIATSQTTADFFYDLMSSASLHSLYGFKNERFLFRGVEHTVTYALLTIGGRDVGFAATEFCWLAWTVEEMQDPDRRIKLSLSDMELFNPNTRTCPVFRNRRDFEIARVIYRHAPILIADGPPERNAWGIHLSRMFDMSLDAEYFRTADQLITAGWNLQGNRFVHGEEEYWPLVEAKLVHHFDHRWASYEDFATSQLLETTDKESPRELSFPRYWLPSTEVRKRLPEWDRAWLIGTRDICRNTDLRTAIASVFPMSAASGIYLTKKLGVSPRLAVCLQANLSAFVLDYAARLKVGGTHLSQVYLKQLPVHEPIKYGDSCDWYRRDSLEGWIVPRVIELSFTAYDLVDYARDCGYSGPPFKWNLDRRLELRCELDAAFLHLYGIGRDAIFHLLENFHVVKGEDTAAYGEYRTKRVILEIYDEMGVAMATGQLYQTRLDPPPAHPDAAHTWDEEYLGPELPKDQWWQEIKPPELVERAEPKPVFSSPPARSTVKEPAPSFELKSPPAKQTQSRAKTQGQPVQAALVTDFTPPQGSRGERLKRVMALGDRVKASPQDTAAISQLVGALGDSDNSIRWLAGSALGLLGGSSVVRTLAAFLEQVEAPEARQEAIKALQRIVDNPREDKQVREMARREVSTNIGKDRPV
jgi:hypothetical protein